MIFGTKKLHISYTPDLPGFLEKELLSPAEFYRIKKEAHERRKQVILKDVAKNNKEVDQYNATHADKKGYTAYVDISCVKFRMMNKYPYVIGKHDYAIERDQAFPLYDSNDFFIGNGFAFEIKQMEDMNMNNVLEIYERDINHVERLVDIGNGNKEWKSGTRRNHINPIPTNPISKYFMARKLLDEYNQIFPEKENKYVTHFFRKDEKIGEFLAIDGNKNNGTYYHFIVPRRLCHSVIEDEMDGDHGPQTEANIVPQLNFPAKDLVKYPMIDFGYPSKFKHYPKGLDGKKMREHEALDSKLGTLPCGAYNWLDKQGVIDEMHRSIDDKYEQIRRAKNSRG